jgi:putative membrane protein
MKKNNIFENSREHLANERTFLAWIRTSIALMGFGFVIVKFTLFLKQFSVAIDSGIDSAKDYGSAVGVIMVVLGIIFSSLAYINYKITQKNLNKKFYVASSTISLILTLIILTGGILLILYLISSTYL